MLISKYSNITELILRTNKRFIALASGLLFGLMAHAQYTVTASQLKMADGTIIYFDREGETSDSAIVQGGAFSIKNDKKVYPAYCTVHTKDGAWGGQFWMGNDNVTIDGTTGNISGSPEEDTYTDYKEALKPAWDKAREVMNERDADFKVNGEKNWSAYNKKIEHYSQDVADSLFVIFCDAHPRAYICLNHIYNHRVLDKYPFKRYAALAKHLDWSAFGGSHWETFTKIYNLDKTLEPGNMFPGSFVGEDPYGVKDSIAA